MKHSSLTLGTSLLLVALVAPADNLKVYQAGEVPNPDDIAAMLGAVPAEGKTRGIVFESAVDNKTIRQTQPAAAAPQSVTSPPEARAFSLPIQFDYNSATLQPDSLPMLNAVAAGIKQVPGAKLVIEGHTDAAGSDSYNQGLSKRRADAVKNYLVKQGTTASAFQVMGMGEARPLEAADPYSEKNRRVEFRLAP